MVWRCRLRCAFRLIPYVVYNGFIASGKKTKWCHDHFLNYQALLRAVAVRSQLFKYMKRFQITMISSDGDAVNVRRCLTAGYFANAARAQPDGTYRTVRDQVVLAIHPNSVLFKRVPPWVVFHEGESAPVLVYNFLRMCESG